MDDLDAIISLIKAFKRDDRNMPDDETWVACCQEQGKSLRDFRLHLRNFYFYILCTENLLKELKNDKKNT